MALEVVEFGRNEYRSVPEGNKNAPGNEQHGTGHGERSLEFLGTATGKDEKI